MPYTGVSVFPTDSDGTQFWALVNWCLDRGATDFSVSTIGLNGYALAALAKEKLHARLADYALGIKRRICPDYFSWEEEDMMVWALDRSSIHVLRDTDIEVPKGYRRRSASSKADAGADIRPSEPQYAPGTGIVVRFASTVGEPTMDPESYAMYLCVYKDGIPMLAVLCEQYNELLLVLTDDDLRAFDRLGLEANYDLIPDFEP